jgi:hypothetical protein
MTFGDINLHPDEKELRTFALLWLVGFGVLGLVVAWRAEAFGAAVPIGWHAPWRAPLALWALAGVGCVVGLAAPAALRPVYVTWMVAAFPIGWTISFVLLAFVYYVLFTAVGLVFRLIGRDVLGRSFDRKATSYWVRRPAPSDIERYFRQF